jgi:hypothetical protein
MNEPVKQGPNTQLAREWWAWVDRHQNIVHIHESRYMVELQVQGQPTHGLELVCMREVIPT